MPVVSDMSLAETPWRYMEVACSSLRSLIPCAWSFLRRAIWCGVMISAGCGEGDHAIGAILIALVDADLSGGLSDLDGVLDGLHRA